MYKPWQFREHTPASVTLKTTYDELFLIAKERAFIRPNFQASKSTVNIPNLFAMVMGVSSNEKEYWDRLQTLTEYKESHTALPVYKGRDVELSIPLQRCA